MSETELFKDRAKEFHYSLRVDEFCQAYKMSLHGNLSMTIHFKLKRLRVHPSQKLNRKRYMCKQN